MNGHSYVSYPRDTLLLYKGDTVIVIRQKSGNTVILGTHAEKTIINALELLEAACLRANDSVQGNYVFSLKHELRK